MRIRKFNESTEPIDIEYIRQCFIELIEEGKAVVNNASGIVHSSEVSVTLMAKGPVKAGEFGGGNIDRIGSGTYLARYTKSLEEFTETMKHAALAIERLADEYPDYRIRIAQTSDKMYILIFL